MKRKKTIIFSLMFLSLIIFINIFNLYFLNEKQNQKLYLTYNVKGEKVDDFQVFYKSQTNDIWNEENSAKNDYNNVNEFQEMIFELPKDTKSIRLDFGNSQGKLQIKNIYLIHEAKRVLKNLEREKAVYQINISNLGNDKYEINSLGNDPFLELDISTIAQDLINEKDYKKEVAKYLISLIGALLIAISLYYIRYTLKFIKDIFINKKMIFSLAKNDFKTKYASSYLGIIWAFVQPLITIALYWFVFQVGLKSTDIGDIPFIVWFICGIVPWFFFAEALSAATSVFLEYGYLVKKVVFKIEILPVVKIISAFFIHLFFIIFMYSVYALYGLNFGMSNFQILYYLICLIVLILAITILTSSLVLFFRDLNQIIAVVLNIGFWFTPIVWSFKTLPEEWRILFKLNPMFYIVQGYRDSLIDNIWFFQRPYHTIYFWTLTLIVLLIGVKLFNKLKVHFADVI